MPSCLPSTLAISQIPQSHSIRSPLFFPKAYTKEVYFNDDLSTTKKLQVSAKGRAGVDLVTDLLGVTLGPKGRNVVLENKYAPPKIVNDGETILKENTEEKFDKKIINERIARLSDGIAIIQVGAQTVVELKDKKLRVEDALNATRAAIEEGVVVGGGCYLLRLSMKVDSIKDFLDNEEQKAGLDLVTDLLGVTLGPKERNVVLENKYAPPKIVNDGETILKEIEEHEIADVVLLVLGMTTRSET